MSHRRMRAAGSDGARVRTTLRLALLATIGLLTGCNLWRSGPSVSQGVDVSHYQYTATQLAEPLVDTPDPGTTAPPLSINSTPTDYWDLGLEEAVSTALANSEVLRDLDGTVLRTPDNARTTHDPSLTESDPRFGVESALSAFDTSFATNAFFERNDRALNNVFFGGGTRQLEQDTFVVQSQLAKRAVTGTELSVRNELTYDANNAPGNAFGGAYDLNPELVLSHPLMAGSGVDFNRIAGPSDTPGLYNGVVVARINTDVNLADFQIGVRNFVNDVENAYWDLYYAYRDLDARIRSRDEALALWQRIHAFYVAGRKGGDAASEAQARAQYYQAEEEVQNALAGRPTDGTATNSGSPGGTFRQTGGVLVAERRLRLLLGLPLADGRALRPADAPPTGKVDFEWYDVVAEGLSRRTELRRQKWLVKRRELELQASRNFLKPELDVVGRYRWRGFGKDLIQQHSDATFELANGPGSARFNDALGTLVNGDFQEWQVGFEFSMPLGARQGKAAVRNAELQLARARTILNEQEREIASDLADAIAELERAYVVLTTTYNRHDAAKAQYDALRAVYEEGEEPLKKEQLYILLDSQRRWTDAEIAYHRATVDYALAIKNVHFEKGSLLDYDQVVLEEGIWPAKAYRDAKEKLRLRSKPVAPGNLRRSRPVSRGPAPQLVVGPTTVPFTVPATDPVESEPPPVVPPNPNPADTAPGDEPPADGGAAESPTTPPPAPAAFGQRNPTLRIDRTEPAKPRRPSAAGDRVRTVAAEKAADAPGTASLDDLDSWIAEQRRAASGGTVVPAVNETREPRSVFELPAVHERERRSSDPTTAPSITPRRYSRPAWETFEPVPKP